jgi:hypothetical protein
MRRDVRVAGAALQVPREARGDNSEQRTAGSAGHALAEVLVERICRTNGFRQLLTKPHAPATTGQGCCGACTHHDRPQIACSVIVVDHLCRSEAAGGC